MTDLTSGAAIAVPASKAEASAASTDPTARPRIKRKDAYRRAALRKSGRNISRKPVAAGVRGRFLSLSIPICRTNAGDENRFITTLY